MKKMLKMLLAMLALCMALTGCSGSNDSDNQGGSTGNNSGSEVESQYGGTYIMRGSGEPLSFNPNWKTDDMQLPATYNIFNRLVKSTLDNSIQPDLAYDWEFSEDGKQLTFYLRENVKWHDGEDFNSDDVVWTFNKILAGDAYQSGTLSNVESVEAVDDYTVTFNLKTPDASIMSVLSWLGVWIMPEHIYNTDVDWSENEANWHPIGTGPFKFVEYQTGVSIKLEAFDDYWGGRPYLDTLIISIIPDAETAYQAYLNGEIDDIQGGTPKASLQDLIDSPDYNTYNHVGTSRTYLSFNLEEGPMADIRVRQAVNLAIDRVAVVERAEKGFGAVSEYYISPVFNWAVNDDYKIPEKDAAKAEELLQEAGYTKNADGYYFSCDYVIFESGSFHDTAIIIQENLKSIGIDCKLEVLEIGAWMTKCIDDYDFDIAMCSGGQGPDISAIRNRVHSDGSLNISRYSNPALDEALNLGITVSSEADRKPYYDEVQRILSEDLPMVIVDDYQIAYPVKSYIHNHPYEYEQASQYNSYMMEKVWIEVDKQLQ